MIKENTQQGQLEEKTPVSEEGAAKASPQEQAKIDGYITGLSKILHGKDTRSSVLQMLSSGPPETTIPQTALQVNDQMEKAIMSKGQKPSLETLAAATGFLVGDLVEIGNAAGTFEIDPEDPNIIGPLLTNTMQPYIEKGLADGSIDPVELQQKVEPLMEEGKARALNDYGTSQGQPDSPGESAAMETYRQRGVLKERETFAKKERQMQQGNQGGRQVQPPQQRGGGI